MITEESDKDTWQVLRSMWLAERKPEFVIFGGNTMRVVTPDGDEHPKFVPQGDFNLYSASSMASGQSVTKSGEQKPNPGPKVIKPAPKGAK